MLENGNVTLGNLIDNGLIEVTVGFPFGGHNNDGDGIPHIRPFNIRIDGRISLEQIKCIPHRAAWRKASLLKNDIIFNNTNTKELVGKCALWGSDDQYVFSNHMTRIRLIQKLADSAYLNFSILHHWFTGKSQMLAMAHVAQASIMGERFREIEIPWASYEDQKKIAKILIEVQNAKRLEEMKTQVAVDLKRTAIRELFTRGLGCERQKTTEIGLVPISWGIGQLQECADILSTRMSYTELEEIKSSEDDDAVMVFGIKVSDMNIPGNEVTIKQATLERRVPRSIASRRCAPPGTIVFPKRGAAIATNKKRISAEWTVFDPNVIGIIGREKIEQRFLFHWFQGFDLRTITEPGPTPQLNKKNLEPVIIPVPPTLEEQREIVEILDTIDRKIDIHKRKRTVLDDLFKSLLHKLMTGEMRVADLDLSAFDDLSTPETETAA